MLFLIESGNEEMKIETFLWKDLIIDKHCPHTFIECHIDDISSILSSHKEPMIPLGSIPFTNRFLQLAHNISQMNPVEIPPIMRNTYFLGREYKIVSHNQIPHVGRYFIKDASGFKTMHYLGEMDNFDRSQLNPNHQYVVSEAIDIQAEYRVYFVRGEVYAIEYYNGNPLILPNTNVILAANALYSTQKDYPGSYTMDIMVTEKGTFLTEIHPVLFACGLYTTVLSTSFLNGYIDSLHYILKHNTPVTAT